MIPEEAVEAANEAFWKDGDGDWAASLRTALEAAAPHIRAGALENAADAIKRDSDPRDTLTINWLKARAGAERSHADAV